MCVAHRYGWLPLKLTTFDKASKLRKLGKFLTIWEREIRELITRSMSALQYHWNYTGVKLE
ncbi:hypothetical protein [Chamaesiphon polymorphus]|uniref:Uncharacterized protein n=1 Tax=Chamaesiphon polymorphus CCALA 037 TaxID=2107692 RepID=A0A2T1GNR5_9CYAN|nr:hypothetical protein [Chamaesiphon polymorphus]PSB59567.1 hypothetical protein C7B77_00245 [Chamaesiphon polymorphus CCALA 037]